MGLRAILLIAAVVLFVLGAFGVDLDEVNLLYLGLACLAGALLVSDLPLTRRRGGRRPTLVERAALRDVCTGSAHSPPIVSVRGRRKR